MSRIERPQDAKVSDPNQPSQESAPAAKKQPEKPPPPALEHSAGSRQLAQRRSPASIFATTILVTEKRTAEQGRQPLPTDGYPGAKEIERLLIAPDAPLLPPQPSVTRPNVRPGSEPDKPEPKKSTGAGGPRPPRHVELHEAYRKASVQHEKLSRGLEAAANAWSVIAADRRERLQADPARGNGEGLEQSVTYAERQSDLCREMLREARQEFGALTSQWELLSGQRKGAAIGPATHTGSARAKSEAEVMRERLDRYNNSVNLYKSAGPLTVVTTAYMAAAALNNRKLDERERAALDEIHALARIPNAVIGLHPRAVPAGAASPAPGVDHRPPPFKTPTEIRSPR